MKKIHERDLRGQTKTGWLDGQHSFSFGRFVDRERMGFRSLRVINEDHIIPGAGFDTHPHNDMEIITYVLEGALEHKDSLGTGSVIQPGDIQKMSAGTGIHHSEFNHSKDEPVHLLQIWIMPDEEGLPPSYEQKTFGLDKPTQGFKLVGDRYGTDGAITIHQDAKMYVAVLKEGQEATHHFEKDRGGWLQVARGEISVEGEVLKQGDGLELVAEEVLSITADVDSELILFDLG